MPRKKTPRRSRKARVSGLPRSPDPLGELRRWLPSLGQLLVAPNGLARLRALIEYLASVADFEPEALHPVVAQLGAAAEETAMTAAERLRQEGRREGRQEKAVEMVLRQLRIRFGTLSDAVERRVRGGTEAELERWSERLLVAEGLEQVFADEPLS